MTDSRYLVSARKYRPQRFGEIVAQEHVGETLKNALRQDRLSHAYLFSGPRGVGKTTAARILAKAINCTGDPAKRPDGVEPCLECDSCRSFSEGRSLNVIEIDAASNRGVDDVRELRDTVRIPPQGALKKVYIVDEVHMLTKVAFNAFLKTLEEPPPYALFIFATTEPRKVIPTILSRCQRFDFRRIALSDIIAHLKKICELEGFTIDEASLLSIARQGDGALRDALSALDQAVALCGTDINFDALSDAFRIVSTDTFFDIVQCIVDRNSAGVLKTVNQAIVAGYDLDELMTGLMEHLRNILIAITMPDTSLIEADTETRGRYEATSTDLNEQDVLRLLMIASEALENLSTARRPRLRVELALLKMVGMHRGVDLAKAIDQLERLEHGLPDAESHAGAKEPVPAPSPAKSRVTEKPKTAKSKPTPKPQAADNAPAPAAAPKEDPHPTTKVAETPPASSPGLFSPPALKTRSEEASAMPVGEPAQLEGSAAIKQAPVAAVDAPSSQLRRVEMEWLSFVRKVKNERIHVGALLQHTAPHTVEERDVVIAVPDDFHRRLLNNQGDFLAAQLATMIEDPAVRLRFVVRRDVKAAAPAETADDFDPYEYMARKRKENPIIRAIFEEFGGEPVW